tara:strand:+ start:387 stop:725 length:339 start_codon:yes stop_codon:yes gene_type:complete
MTSVEKILFSKILNINRLKPKCAIFCEKFLNFFNKKSLDVIKNKKKAEDTNMVFIRNFVFEYSIINKDSKNEIMKNKNKYNLFFNSDFTHFSFGPIAMAIKNGIKKGIINLL